MAVPVPAAGLAGALPAGVFCPTLSCLTHLPFGAYTPTDIQIQSTLSCAHFGRLFSGGLVSGEGTGG